MIYKAPKSEWTVSGRVKCYVELFCTLVSWTCMWHVFWSQTLSFCLTGPLFLSDIRLDHFSRVKICVTCCEMKSTWLYFAYFRVWLWWWLFRQPPCICDSDCVHQLICFSAWWLIRARSVYFQLFFIDQEQQLSIGLRLWKEVKKEVDDNSTIYSTLDLRVAAVKSTESTWPLQVKSSRFSYKSPPKFSTQVAAEF